MSECGLKSVDVSMLSSSQLDEQLCVCVCVCVCSITCPEEVNVTPSYFSLIITTIGVKQDPSVCCHFTSSHLTFYHKCCNNLTFIGLCTDTKTSFLWELTRKKVVMSPGDKFKLLFSCHMFMLPCLEVWSRSISAYSLASSIPTWGWWVICSRSRDVLTWGWRWDKTSLSMTFMSCNIRATGQF